MKEEGLSYLLSAHSQCFAGLFRGLLVSGVLSVGAVLV